MDDMLESQAIRELENIARAIRKLEGLPIDFRLAKKLHEILEMIADSCAPNQEQQEQC